jgi:glucokinase
MLTLGTGVGGGVILNGRIWHGMTGMAGELGHVTVESNGVPCKCGNLGCLEKYASATAVVRMAKEAIDSGQAPELKKAMSDTPEFSSKNVYQMAIQGDEPAQAIYRKVGSALGIGLAGMINILNLPMFVIGGGMASAWDAFAPTMMEEVKKRSFVFRATTPPPTGKIEPGKTIVTRAMLGSDAGLFGAALLPMLPEEVAEAHQIRKQA